MSFSLFTRDIDDEGIETNTSEMEKTKNQSINILKSRTFEWYLGDHIGFLSKLINNVSTSRQKAETTIPQLANFALSAFPMLGLDKSEKYGIVCQKMREFLSHRVTTGGYFSGFPDDNPNIVNNLFAISAIAIIGTEEAYKLIDRKKFYNLILSLKQPDGSFLAAEGAECDLRSTYSSLAIASMLNILTPELKENVIDFTKKCLNYDGGFSPSPHCESHGGFVHCGIGILYILDALDEINLNPVIQYIAMRQNEFSGGFTGRTNKLVDSCYTWWMGTAAKIISHHLNIPNFWNVECMSEYILRCSQIHSGGFCDSPPNESDPLHTCYALSGLCMIGSGAKVHVDLPELDLLVPVPKESIIKLREYFASLGDFSKE